MTAPTIETPKGKAWDVDLSKHPSPGEHATVAFWVVEARWAHPLWHSYLIIGVHLRPMRDGRETKIYLQGATHEIHVYALDPKGDVGKLVETADWKHCQPLQPVNYAGQFIAENDRAAAEKIRQAVVDICDGKLSPDTDFIRHWGHRFGFNMMKTGAGETKIVEIHDDGSTTPILTIPPRKAPQDHN